MSEEKTEQPTSKKLSKARSEGQVAKSTEISSVAILLTSIIILYFLSYSFYLNITGIMRESFSFDKIPNINIVYCINLFSKNADNYYLMLLPLLIPIALTAFISNVLQVGFKMSSGAIAPKFSKLNMLKGIKKLFSANSISELIKSILKIIIIGTVIYHVLKYEITTLGILYDTSIEYILLYILKIFFKLFIYVIFIMIIIAILDYAFVKYKFMQDMKMTKQEVKEETKQAEGDPLVKSRIKSMQMEMARKRMMQEVPEADFVLTNPTHLALAIKYDPGAMNAPTVLAKGAGTIAERIKHIAKEHGIPIIENKNLAQNLYKLVEIGQEVPLQFFGAVAEILAYVYRLKGKSL